MADGQRRCKQNPWSEWRHFDDHRTGDPMTPRLHLPLALPHYAQPTRCHFDGSGSGAGVDSSCISRGVPTGRLRLATSSTRASLSARFNKKYCARQALRTSSPTLECRWAANFVRRSNRSGLKRMVVFLVNPYLTAVSMSTYGCYREFSCSSINPRSVA